MEGIGRDKRSSLFGLFVIEEGIGSDKRSSLFGLFPIEKEKNFYNSIRYHWVAYSINHYWFVIYGLRSKLVCLSKPENVSDNNQKNQRHSA